MNDALHHEPIAQPQTATDFFEDRLIWWLQMEDDNVAASQARLDLIQACGALWNHTGIVPERLRHEVRDAIGNWKNADDWEAGGHRYSVAARAISARLKREMKD